MRYAGTKPQVVPYMLDVREADIEGPLVAYFNQQATEEGTRKLLNDINETMGAFKQEREEFN